MRRPRRGKGSRNVAGTAKHRNRWRTWGCGRRRRCPSGTGVMRLRARRGGASKPDAVLVRYKVPYSNTVAACDDTVANVNAVRRDSDAAKAPTISGFVEARLRLLLGLHRGPLTWMRGERHGRGTAATILTTETKIAIAASDSRIFSVSVKRSVPCARHVQIILRYLRYQRDEHAPGPEEPLVPLRDHNLCFFPPRARSSGRGAGISVPIRADLI